ncbi:alpha-amylase family glycosyl hydrolase [uncultured Bacteroides sp.]|uniref:alpha-amylase family glycosyl hydrolase n=1 Tax=uncultured Bacteroides sp. TaxID=162156 RepID=UPI00262BEF90|nr:alpha-amylase family glycosyl hydrolase [uncultured Bacteroides sp.]
MKDLKQLWRLFSVFQLSCVCVLLMGLAACSDDNPVTPEPEPEPEPEPVEVPEGLSWIPEEPDADHELTIYFKAAASSELKGYTGEVYIHTGVVSEGTWLYVPAEWDENLDKCRMERIEDNTWSIKLQPSVRQWFGSGETPVQKLGVVIRSADGTKKGVEEDLFIPVKDNVYTGFQPGEVKTGTMPQGLVEGINVVDASTVTLVLYDLDKNGQRKDYAHVVGDFNQWTLSNDEHSQMTRDEQAGCWWITLTGLEPGREYAFQYYVGMKGEDPIRLADAYTTKVLDPDNDKYIPASTYDESLTYPKGGRGIVSTFNTQPEQYSWAVADFQMPVHESMLIYELHLRDFTETGDLEGAMAKLPYLKELGINAIELMPVQEFDGNDSWGYNPCFFFALDKAYGTPRMYKKFIDACHQAGIAVLFDVVYNHATGSCPLAKLYWDSANNKTASNNPYFNVDAPHPYSVFHDFNHESPLVRKFIKRNLQYLLTEYHIDGFRFDLTKGFTQQSSTEATAGNYDADRIAILKDYYEAIREVKEDAFVVLEHFCDTREETELAQAGLHLWRNMNNAYCQSGMGWEDESAFTSLYEKKPAWVGYMESHDEERVSYKQKTYGNYDFKTNLATRMDQLEVNAAFFLTVPGPKMVWQFGEMGYDVSIEENGRTGRKPLHWEYLEDADRKSVHDTYVHLAKLRNAAPELFDATGTFTWKVAVTNWANGRILYSESVTGKKLMVMGNFTNAAINVSLPAEGGDWTNYMTGETETLTGSVSLPAHGYVVYTKGM